MRGGLAISKGSALAMAALAFAAVYREGFETVLFYQALSFETGPTAVMAGFLPGLALIGAVGVGIVRMGIRLPIRRLFAITNAVLASPYEEQPRFARYAEPPRPDERVRQTFCGT